MLRSTPKSMPATHHETTAQWSRRDWLIIIGVVVLATALGWLARAQEIGVDEATQITLAKSIASGHYRDEYLVGQPVHAQYPPLMSVWFLIVQLFAGPSLDAVRAVNLVLHTASAILIGDSLRRLGWSIVGLAATAVIVLNPFLLDLAGTVRSETLYVTLVSFALWSSVPQKRIGGRQGLVTALAAGAAFLTRSAGISIVGAMAVVVARRHRRFTLGLGLLLAAIVTGWFVFSFRRGGGAGASYANDLSMIHGSPAGLVRHAVAVLTEYAIRTPFMQFGLPNVPTKLDTAIGAVAIPALTAVGMFHLARSWPLSVANLILGIGVLVVWPWTDGRFLAPLVPSIVAMMLVGIAGSPRLFGPRSGTIAVAVAIILALSAAATDLRAAAAGASCRQDPMSLSDAACNHAETRAIAPASRFLRDSVPHGAIVATPKNALVNYISGHPTVQIFNRAPDRRLAFLSPGSGVDYLIVATQGVSFDPAVLTELAAACGELVVVREFPSGTFILAHRRLDRDGAAACSSIDATLLHTSHEDD